MQQYPPPNLQQQPPPLPPTRSPHVVAIPQKNKRDPKRSATDKQLRWLLLGLTGLIGIILLAFLVAIGLAVLVLYGSGDILPNVTVAGVEVGRLSEEEAAIRLSQEWTGGGILLRDGDRTWSEDPANLGLTIDAPSTAQAAQNWGRGEGGISGGLEALLVGVEIPPKLNVDLAQARARLEEVRSIVEEPAQNAGIRLVDGQVQAVPSVQGRLLDIEATLAKLQADSADELADGAIDLVMLPTAPSVTDATPLLQEAQALLSQTFTIEAYDPVNNTSQVWTLTPDQWGQWLVANQDSSSPTGLSFALDQTNLTAFLDQQSQQLTAPAYLNQEESLTRINTALTNKNLNTWIRIYHQPSTYTVQSGDSISSIGYQLGIPYPWIQAANPNVSALNVGDVVNIPSKDDLLPLPIVRNKRIVISISQQQMWAYENGQVLWNWKVSTGIARSPTSPGIFQIQSHDVNAYAAQWNLYMPHFMGVYHPGPNAGVMNGFHGFPTDATGGYLLWTDDLGRPATYGCILLSLENAATLYDWAEEGVVVEIQA